MFLGPTGDTLFYKRRMDGLDALYAFQPDSGRVEIHAQLASCPDQIRAWPTKSGQIIVCTGWPRSPGGLRLKFYDARRISGLLEGKVKKLNEKLTDVPSLSDFSTERKALPVRVFEAVKGEHITIPGLAPVTEDGRQSPVLYEIDGETASYRIAPLSFMDQQALPGGLYEQPGGERRWLSVGDSNHLFVLDGRSHEMVGDVIWPAEQSALARVAFHPTRNEVWISALASVFVFDRESLKQLGEIPIESELRWHRGERVSGFIGGIVFSNDGEKALVARPLSGDVLEVDAATRKPRQNMPVVVDPLELCMAPGVGRVYMQSLRNGNISWLPYR